MNIDEFIEHTQERAREHRCHADFFESDNPMRTACTKSAEDCEWLADCLTKFKDYQQLEKQGLLLRLPCKVGDTVYYIKNENMLNELIVYSFGIRPLQHFVCDDSGTRLNFNQFGKTVFLTKSEAEARLRELRGNQNGKV